MPKKKTKKSNINSNGELKISKMLSKNVANKTKEIDEERSVKGKDDRSRSSDRALQKKTKARKAEQTGTCVDEVKIKRNAKLPPLPNRVPKQSSTSATVKTESNVGCFGFMSTWIRKRKEKRRQKKREAIKARETNSTCMVTKLNRCERGGVAFTVEFENHVMKKPILPPIKSKSESVNIDHEGKMYKAEKNRQEQLQKKMRFVQEKEKKRQVYV
ncbi:hypothetical protein ACF0H5_000058 [Mactra antiquata]